MPNACFAKLAGNVQSDSQCSFYNEHFAMPDDRRGVMNDRINKVTSTDGQAKRVMWDGEWHELPAGESRFFPEHIAVHFERYHSFYDDEGVRVCSVQREPVQGEVHLAPVQAPPQKYPCGFPKCSFETGDTAELR